MDIPNAPTRLPGLLQPIFGCLLLLVSCATGGPQQEGWVYRIPQRQSLLTAYQETLQEPSVQCQFETDSPTPLEATIVQLFQKDPSRWIPTRCHALAQVCQAGSALSDHGLEREAEQWQQFCDFFQVCRERNRRLVQLDETLSRWQPPLLLTLAQQWPTTEARYGQDLAHHEPEVAANVRQRHQLLAAAHASQCRWSLHFARTFVRTGLALMGPDQRTLTYLAGELARRDPSSGTLLDRLTPATKAYSTLQQAYVHYREIAAQGGFHELPGTCKGLRRSSRRDPRHGLLAVRLAQEGLYVDPGKGNAWIPFNGPLEEAVKRFQRMHHLPETGTIGPATLTALNQSAGAKKVALNAALATYRKAVPPYETTLMLVQMPAAFVEVYISGELRRLERAIIGRGRRDPDGTRPFATPVLDATITTVIFNPVWHVPSGIARDEIEPLLARDPGYLARNNYRREAIRDQRVRYLQLPGPANALGRVKFHFANSHDVYLHDTPSKHLFKKSRRLFSHGCVRLQHATKVAALLLNRDQGFSWDQLRSVLKSDTTTEYRLKTPIPVHLLYSAAAADGEGNLHFLPDLYGHEQATEDN